VPFIASQYGWRTAFVATGAIGLIWLIFWFWLYEVPAKQKRLSKEEFNYIHSDTDEQVAVAAATETEKKLSWGKLLAYRQTWAFALGKFLTDGIWWFYLFWLPKFLKAEFGLTKGQIAVPVALVYVIASVGSIFGGWLPMRFIKNGLPVYKARKNSMLIYAFCVLPVVAAQLLGDYNMWFAILIIGLAAAAHQAWSANIFTTVSDMFPKPAVASVTGIGGMAGGLGGILISYLAGILFDHYKALGKIQTGYLIMFFICGSAYLIAWLVMHFLVPRMKRIEI
jgi:ACS family hexuronate transporter-like MFS transporter